MARTSVSSSRKSPQPTSMASGCASAPAALAPRLTVTVGGETIFELEETSLAERRGRLGAGEGDEGRTEILFDNFVAASLPVRRGRPWHGGEPWPPASRRKCRLIHGTAAPVRIDRRPPREGGCRGVDVRAGVDHRLKLLVGETDPAMAAVHGLVPLCLGGTGRVLQSQALPPDWHRSRRPVPRSSGCYGHLSPQDRLDEYANPGRRQPSVRTPGILPRRSTRETRTQRCLKQGFPAGSKVKCLAATSRAISPGTARIYYPAT